MLHASVLDNLCMDTSRIRVVTKNEKVRYTMHGLHARLGKNFNLEERLTRYASAIVQRPKNLRGHWKTWCHTQTWDDAHKRFLQTSFRELHIDLGCGKGDFLIESAQRNPDILFVGIDFEPLCIAYAAQKICEHRLKNALVFGGSAAHMQDWFGKEEIDRLYINFPTPYPRKKQAHMRLVYLDNLLTYHPLLAKDARLIFKTDSYPLMQFAQTQFERAGYELMWESSDARGARPHDPMSHYEEKLSAQGAHVLAKEYRTCEIPSDIQQVSRMSLVDWLPEDIHDMAYVPHGMQGTFVNRINYEKRHQGAHLDSHGQAVDTNSKA